MSIEQQTTINNIMLAAKTEFLEKGFRGASLRSIVKAANVTTGAFYGYYKSKEDLFEALVGKQAEKMMNTYIDAQNAFAGLPPEEQQNNMSEISGNCMEEMLDYAYDNLDEFKLILLCSEGTKYENYIHEMVEIEVDATHKFNETLRGLGIESKLMNPQLEHMLVSGMFTAYFEMIIHEMPRKAAHEYLKDLREFYTAGWKKIMGF